jgi:hypothetical protein
VGPDGNCLDSCQADLSAFYAETGSLVFQQHEKEYKKTFNYKKTEKAQKTTFVKGKLEHSY